MSRWIAELSDEMKSALNPDNVYHLRRRDSDNYQAVVCGVMHATSDYWTYHSVMVARLKCAECGVFKDVTDYEEIWVGPDVDQSILVKE